MATRSSPFSVDSQVSLTQSCLALVEFFFFLKHYLLAISTQIPWLSATDGPHSYPLCFSCGIKWSPVSVCLVPNKWCSSQIHLLPSLPIFPSSNQPTKTALLP